MQEFLMPIIVKFRVMGMTSEKYEIMLTLLSKAGWGAPRGRLYHVSYGATDALQFIDVYDSMASFDAFDKKLMPVLKSLGIVAEPDVHEAYRAIKV
jgi:hypothetical protein